MFLRVVLDTDKQYRGHSGNNHSQERFRTANLGLPVRQSQAEGSFLPFHGPGSSSPHCQSVKTLYKLGIAAHLNLG